MLLYLMKYSRPDIANAVRELSKVLYGSTEASFKEILRVIKYVLDTKEMGIRIKPKLPKSASDEPWICYSDIASMLVIPTHEGVSRGISFMLKVSPYAGGQKLKGALLCPAVKLSGLLCQKQQRRLCYCAAIIGEYAHQS
jgi:hypothetical protein